MNKTTVDGPALTTSKVKVDDRQMEVQEKEIRGAVLIFVSARLPQGQRQSKREMFLCTLTSQRSQRLFLMPSSIISFMENMFNFPLFINSC